MCIGVQCAVALHNLKCGDATPARAEGSTNKAVVNAAISAHNEERGGQRILGTEVQFDECVRTCPGAKDLANPSYLLEVINAALPFLNAELQGTHHVRLTDATSKQAKMQPAAD